MLIFVEVNILLFLSFSVSSSEILELSSHLLLLVPRCHVLCLGGYIHNIIKICNWS